MKKFLQRSLGWFAFFLRGKKRGFTIVKVFFINYSNKISDISVLRKFFLIILINVRFNCLILRIT